MKLIGIEEHFLTADIFEAWHAIGLDATDPSVAFHSDAVGHRLLDLAEACLALMDETGLDMQVLSLTMPGLHDLGRDSLDLARRTNDLLAEVVARHPTRFQAMATLPVAMPEEAERELERCVTTFGFKGTMLCGRVEGRSLDDPAFLPLFEAAAALSVPILLHPRAPVKAVRDAYYSGFTPQIDVAFATYGLGWHYDAGIQLVSRPWTGSLPGRFGAMGSFGFKARAGGKGSGSCFETGFDTAILGRSGVQLLGPVGSH